MKRSELKEKAKNQIKGHLLELFVFDLIIIFLCGLQYAKDIFWVPQHSVNLNFWDPININLSVPTPFTILQIIASLIGPACILAGHKIYLNISKHNRKIRFNDFFSEIDLLGRSWWLYIIQAIFIFLWSLLLIIPGIIKAISYSMSFYILAENPNMTAREALQESKNLMKGNKMKYFILSLSFFWWYLLAIVTFGIALVYIRPYFSATLTNFYLDIKKSKLDAESSQSE